MVSDFPQSKFSQPKQNTISALDLINMTLAAAATAAPAVTAATAAAAEVTAVTAAAVSIITTGYTCLVIIGMINYNYLTVFGSAEDLF